ncbi:hypothetical protein FisN_16Lu028 [Fistulifera solaris]|uniref:DUF6824 domain-containing protein n=1 Tax=Fistulifera solaris TaxID=1519565 RepID=A0A1Z5KIW2_FISSO|nr:hypothetical protein FisN_16Lu028 [Fistulifera solaris]|eukprot:GAX26209.1 hypothetical protein FisN_16Lu028 [Fistulifera solaris]
MFTMNCKSDDELDNDLSIDQVKAQRLSEFAEDTQEQSEDDEDDSSVAMVDEIILNEYNQESGKERWKDYPLKDIENPHKHDVLYGRGGHTNTHEGNKQFRKMVKDYQLDYILLQRRNEKTQLAREIVSAWRKQDPPGRFLKMDETGKWYDVGNENAREKTSQLFREEAPLIRQLFEYTSFKFKQDESGELEEFDEVQLTPFSEETNSLNGESEESDEVQPTPWSEETITLNGESKESDKVQPTPWSEEANSSNGESKESDEVQPTPWSEETNSSNDLLGLGFDGEESIRRSSPFYSAFLGNDILDSNSCGASSSYLENVDDSPRETILGHDLLEIGMYSKLENYKKALEWEVSSLKRKKDTGLAVCSIKHKSKNKSSLTGVLLERMEPAIQNTMLEKPMDKKIRELSAELEKKARLL